MAEPIPLPTPAQTATLRALLVPLARVSALVFVLGIIFCVDVFCRAIFGTLEGSIGWIPFVNRVIATPLHRIDQKVSNYLGGLESHIDISMGGYIHALAIAVGQLASGEAEAGWAMWLIAKAVHATRVAVDALPSTGSVTGKITRITKVYKTFPRYITNVYKIASHALPLSFIHTLTAIAGTLGDVVTGDIPNLWKRLRWLEREIERLGHRVRGGRAIIGASVFAGLLVAALAKLGLGWTRCSNVKRVGKSVCGMNPDLLGSLLAGALVLASPISVVDLTKAAQAFTSEAEDGLRWFVRELQ